MGCLHWNVVMLNPGIFWAAHDHPYRGLGYDQTFLSLIKKKKKQSCLINSLTAQGHIINDITKSALWRPKGAYTGLLVYQGKLFFLKFLLVLLIIVLSFLVLNHHLVKINQENKLKRDMYMNVNHIPNLKKKGRIKKWKKENGAAGYKNCFCQSLPRVKKVNAGFVSYY